MAKQKFTDEDDALLSELGVEVEARKLASHTPREERIIAGFEEIVRFVEKEGRAPQNGEEKDIFERMYAVRLGKIRASAECREVLAELDTLGLLEGDDVEIEALPDDMDDDELLAELGVDAGAESDITKLSHVKTRAEIKAAEEVAQRTPCTDFEEFEPLFKAVQEEIKSGVRKTFEFKEYASVKPGSFFILSGQTIYVAEVGEEFKAPNGATDARLRVIYDNGTESDILLRSLQRALGKDKAGGKGRRISDPDLAPLFTGVKEKDDIESGTIYVLRSNSKEPFITENRELVHKIGVTGGDVKRRIANAKKDPTYLLADVEVVATYKLSNINRTKLEKLIQKVLEPAQLDIEIKDRFGNPVIPREWFLVPLDVVDEVVEKIKDGTIVDYFYDPSSGKIIKRK